MDGNVIYNHLQPKQILDVLKYSCRSLEEPEKELCEIVNNETNDGRNMSIYSNLLSKAVESIVEKKNDGDVLDFITGSKVDLKKGKISGIDDFELISFVIVR